MGLDGTRPEPRWTGRPVSYGVQALTLTADTQLVYDQPASGEALITSSRLAVNPGSTTKKLELPAAATPTTGVWLEIVHTGTTATAGLVIATSAGVPIDYLGPGEKGTYFLDTTTSYSGRWTVGSRYFYREDFVAIATSTTLPSWLTTKDTSAAGAPTLAYTMDVHGGIYNMAMSATNEVQVLTLYSSNNLWIDIAKKPKIRARLKVVSDVTGATALFAAGDKFVFGLGSDQNDAEDDITRNLWFMFAGANHNIYIEGDDGTTDTDDTDTTTDWVEDTYLDLEIDASDLGTCRFRVNGVLQSTTIAIAAATGQVQPFFQLRKAAAANFDHSLSIDYLEVEGFR